MKMLDISIPVTIPYHKYTESVVGCDSPTRVDVDLSELLPSNVIAVECPDAMERMVIEQVVELGYDRLSEFLKTQKAKEVQA